MDNFIKYFIKPKSKGFKKNLELWKLNCIDYKKYKDGDNPEDIFLFYHNEAGFCQHPECNKKTKFISLGRGFKETCCRIHSMELTSLRKYGVKYKSQLPEFREKVKNTNLKKYGTENVFSSEQIKDKIKKTNLEKYGVENPMQIKEVQEKVKNTTIERHGSIGFQNEKYKLAMNEKYGFDNPSKISKFQEKKKETFIEKYGVENPMQNKEIQNKAKNTNLRKYGTENVFSSEQIKDKIKKSNLEKYGVENPMQIKEVQEKVSKTHKLRYSENHWMRNQEVIDKRKKTYLERFGVEHPMQTNEVFEKNLNSAYRRKEYKWKSGEISLVQGYEPQVLSELEEKGYTYMDIKTAQTDMPEIWYYKGDVKRRYFPDIYIPSENLIIEVKSSFTLNNDLETNELKFEAVKNAGFNFKLEVR